MNTPVDMILFCPACRVQHIDRDERPSDREWAAQSAGDREVQYWANPPHRSHLCGNCGHIWRPADVPTNGVASIKTKGANDSGPLVLLREPFPEDMREGESLDAYTKRKNASLVENRIKECWLSDAHPELLQLLFTWRHTEARTPGAVVSWAAVERYLVANLKDAPR